MRSASARTTASVVLTVVGVLFLLSGTVAFYARQQLIDERAFADRAVAALDDDRVRHVVGRELVVAAIERGSTDLVAARPMLESVVEALIGTEPFRRAFRAAAVQTNRIFLTRDERNALFDLGDAAQLVRFSLRSVSPKLAREVPRELDPHLLTLQRDEIAGRALAVADVLRPLGLVLPLLALAAFVGAVAAAPDRRIGVLRVGVGVSAAGVLLAIALLVLRDRTLASIVAEDELTDEELRDAVAGVLDAYLGDLVAWGLLLALLGVVLAAAATGLEPARNPLRRLAWRPRTTKGRALRGGAALGLGVAVVLRPSLALNVAAIAAGCWLVFFGMSELLALLGRPAREQRRARGRALAVAGTSGAAIAAVLVALVLVVTAGGPEPSTAAIPIAGGCNGSPAYCDLRLNEAVFAGTHNSFSAADSRGWFIANQRRTIERQLVDGIRLFLIDPHWGAEAGDGRVRTDFKAEARDRNRVAKALPPDVLGAAERLAGRLGAGDTNAPRDVWLCHSVCELGATRMVDSLAVMREFLDANRGEIVILFIEPYVPPAEIEQRFQDAGLERYVATLAHDEPLPTLGELVRSNRRVIVLTEKDADGTVPWYLDGFSFVQDTPLGATRVDQLSCRRERGTADSPLLMLNHWADLFPPRRRANGPFQPERVILDRAHRCARENGLPVNLIAVDHYDQGDLVSAVETLNGERVAAHRRREGG